MLNRFFSFFERLPLTKVIIGCILIVSVVVLLKQCDKRQVKEIQNVSLKSGEQTAVIIGPNSSTIVVTKAGSSTGDRIRSSLLRRWKSEPSSNSGQVVSRIDGARGIRISISDKGNVTVTARTKGFCFEPGLGLYTTTSDRRIFTDVQLAFARRHGVNVGFGLGLGKPLTGAAFIAYSYNFYSNSSILVGYDTKQEVLVGLRVKF